MTLVPQPSKEFVLPPNITNDGRPIITLSPRYVRFQSLKKEMDWERSTEERSASSEISTDYRLPPDPVSSSLSSLSLSLYISIYSNLLTTFYSRTFSLLCIYISITVIVAVPRTRLIRNPVYLPVLRRESRMSRWCESCNKIIERKKK